MKRFKEKFGIYISHLENVASDKTYTAKERSRITGFVKEWKTSKMLSNVCFYIDVLEPVCKLSKLLQQENINTVKAAIAMEKINKNFRKLESKASNTFSPPKRYFPGTAGCRQRRNDVPRCVVKKLE